MTEKYKKIFSRVLLGAGVLWLLAFIVDILIPWLRHLLRYPDIPIPFSEYGSVVSTVAGIVCIAAVLIALIVCRVKSRREKKN